MTAPAPAADPDRHRLVGDVDHHIDVAGGWADSSVFKGIVLRAQAAGKLRRDFVPEDFALLLMANAGVVRVMSVTAPTAWRRFAAVFLDGCRQEAAGELPTPPSAARVVGALRRQAEGRGSRG